MRLFAKDKAASEEKIFPLIAIKEMVLFPHSASPIYIQKHAALHSIEQAMKSKRNIILAYYRGNDTRLTLDNLNECATLARIVQIMKLPNNSSRVVLEGVEKLRLIRIDEQQGGYKGVGEAIILDNEINQELTIRMKALQDNFRNFAKDNKKVSREMLQAIDSSTNPHILVDQILSQIIIPYEKKLSFLNSVHTLNRLDDLALELESEIETLSLKKDINKRVKERMNESHREFVITEQIKELNKELNKEDDPSGIKELEQKLKDLEMPDEVQDKAGNELSRLKRLQPISPEAGILRGYLEWITTLPWVKHSRDRIDLEESARILDEDHYGMEEPKERILDFLAVLQMKQNLKGPILCFVGAPGTGKTSLGKSMSRAMGRNFVRISVGGLRDEAEIRGHRRTYVGALPGKIIQGLKRAGSSNPVFLLDEIDKLANDHRGDPSSALLEVLDPEQNKSFIDHYMEVPVDLSRILFITTANSLHGIPYPLRDRMEIIQIPGYTSIEKLKIAQGFIIPKQRQEHGLEWADVKFSRQAINTIVDGYTRESGVRSLEREIAKVIRKIARTAVEEGKIIPPEIKEEQAEDAELIRTEAENLDGEKVIADTVRSEKMEFSYHVGLKDIKKFLGVRKFNSDLLYKDNPAGLVYGMAWTELGGKLLPVEAIVLNSKDKGEMTLTGSLGDIMKESARIGLSVVRKIIEQKKFETGSVNAQTANIHIHVPEGAIPKDGPSAGLTLTITLFSLFTNRALKPFTAMTGEITLTGRILPVGGIKEKVLAAHRNEFTRILLPAGNKKDYDELPIEVKKSVTFIFVENIMEAIAEVFPVGT